MTETNEATHTAPDELTQFCPQCDYDVFGLTEDRCPECGTAFNRNTLPFRLRGVPKARTGLNWLLVVAVLSSIVNTSYGRSGLNTAVQLVWIGMFLGCAIFWAWLRRAEWYYGSRPYLLLWLLLLFPGMAGRGYLPKAVQTGLEGFAILSCAAILLFTLVRSPWLTISYLMTAIGLNLTMGGGFGLLCSLTFLISGLIRGTNRGFGFDEGVNYLLTAALSLIAGVLGLAMTFGSIRLRRQP